MKWKAYIEQNIKYDTDFDIPHISRKPEFLGGVKSLVASFGRSRGVRGSASRDLQEYDAELEGRKAVFYIAMLREAMRLYYFIDEIEAGLL
jgi:hypothetical protein